MVKSSPAQESFNGGEWSPHLWGRQSGVESYENSCRELTNYLPLVQGPAVFRAGFRYVRRTSDLSNSVLIRFEVGTQQAYFIEFGNFECRFYTEQGIITEDPQAITAATQADPVEITVAGHGFDDGDEVFITSVNGMSQLNNRFYRVANATTDTFELIGDDGEPVDGSAYDAYVSGGFVAKIFVLDSPYSSDEVSELYHTQSADVLFIAHANHPPQTLVRVSPSEFVFEEFDLKDGPYRDVNTTSTTLNPSGTTGTVTMVASSTTGINGGEGFRADDVGRLLRIRASSGDWAWGKITAVSDTLNITVDLEGTLGASTATANWQLGAFSEGEGWPEVVTFYQDRLTFVEAAGEQQGVWLSKRGDYNNFSPTEPNGDVLASSAITLFLNSNTVNKAYWAVPVSRKLVIGTSNSEWTLGASTSGEALTAATAVADETTTFGSAKIRAVKVNNTALFVSATQRSIGQIRFSFESNNYEANDMNLFADHIMRSGVRQIAYSRDPENRLYVVMESGEILTMAYKPDQNVNGWSRITTNGRVRSCAVVPRNGGRNIVGIIVEREIAGQTFKFIEVKDDEVDIDETVESSKYLDCSANYDGRNRPDAAISLSDTTGTVTITANDDVFADAQEGDWIRCARCIVNSPIAEIISIDSDSQVTAQVLSDFVFNEQYDSGRWELLRRIDQVDRLWHLEGQTVQVMADGASHPDIVIENGIAQLNDKYFVVHIGLGYMGRLVTKMFNTGAQLGSAQGRKKRVNRVVVHLLNSLSLAIGVTDYRMRDNSRMDETLNRSVDDRMDLTTGGVSGFFEYSLTPYNQREGSVVLGQNQPLPQTIISVMPQMDTYEE